MTQMTRRFVVHRPQPATAKAKPQLEPKPQPQRPPVKPGDAVRPKETGGPEGPEPTRYGDWERKGLCVDF